MHDDERERSEVEQMDAALGKVIERCARMPRTVEEAYDSDPVAFAILAMDVHDASAEFLALVRAKGEMIDAELSAIEAAARAVFIEPEPN